jgi:NAD(P)-dependent dehydrogenase (short-subunit alcohol dehydrogenase family)
MTRLSGKVAVITGAASGIGRATASLFAREGAKVVVVDIDEQAGKQAVENIRAEGGEAMFVKADITIATDVQNAMRATVQKYGKLDILVNNTGISPTGTVVDTKEEVWDRIIDTNLKGVFLGSKYAIPEMRKGGVIVNMASISGLVARQGEAAYDASKGGVVMLTKAMALDHVPQKIRVNCVCPGTIRTPLIERIIAESANPEESLKKFESLHPIGRLGKPEEVAHAVLYLASDESSFVTGSALVVDGGRTAA